MNITMTGRHVEIRDDVRDYVTEKASRLPKFYDRIHEVEFVLELNADQFTAELIVRVERKNTLIASETGPDPVVLVDVIVDKMERQLRKHKEKLKNRKHDGRPDSVEAPDISEEPEEEAV